jgi:NTE family protein
MNSPNQGAPTISLVLGSGGARGYAHVGVIEELLAQGYVIRSIAGSSMGALVGGVYAAGKLGEYRDWVASLQKLDVLRMMDWSWRGGGLIKGERIIGALKDLVGEIDIENLPIPYTAVAVDIDAEREVWFSQGSLFEAIRASISIPTVFRPHYYQGRRLVDGGLLNPVPITPTLRDLTDYTIAVDVNAPERQGEVEKPVTQPEANPPAADLPAPMPPTVPLDALGAETQPGGETAAVKARGLGGVRRHFAALLESLMDRRTAVPALGLDGLPQMGMVELFARSLDTVQATLTRFKVAAQPPDLLIEIPRDVGAFYEFHRAEEFIALGRERARASLARWQPRRNGR